MKLIHWTVLCVTLAGWAAWASTTDSPTPPVYQAPPPLVQPVLESPPPPAPAAPKVANPAAAPVAPAPAPGSLALPPKRSAAELEKLVAPIALYPDPLVAAVLPASAYPIEVVMAARFVKNTNNLSKVSEQPWDESVKTVARFPDVIQKMSDDLGWTADLGQAFVTQQRDVLDAVQTMRNKARAAGTLQSTPEQSVVVSNVVTQQAMGPEVVYVTNTVVQIQPAQPDVIYVPQYNPAIVYAPPYYYYDPYVPFVTFGLGVWFGSGFWWGCNWWGGWAWCGPPCHAPCYPAGHYPDHHGDPHHGGGGPPPGGAHAPPATHPMATAGRPGSAAAPVAASQRPWQPDANRLQAAGTRGSLASVSGQPVAHPAKVNPASLSARPTAGSSARFAAPSTTGVRFNAPPAAPGMAGPTQSGYSARTGGYQSSARSIPAGSAPGAPGPGQSAYPARTGGYQTSVRTVPAGSAPGTVAGRTSASYSAPAAQGTYRGPSTYGGSTYPSYARPAPSIAHGASAMGGWAPPASPGYSSSTFSGGRSYGGASPSVGASAGSFSSPGRVGGSFSGGGGGRSAGSFGGGGFHGGGKR